MPLVLASTSPFRRALLTAAGLPFEAVAPEVEEHAHPGVAPRALARQLALLKAEAVSARRPQALVIGSDQTIELDGELLRKPASRREAARQLRALSGRTHRLHTGIALCRASPRWRRAEVESVRLTMRPLARRELEAYLDTREWEGCAGGYRLESQGIKLFERVEGDYHAVVGLPVLRLVKMLNQAGWPLF